MRHAGDDFGIPKLTGMAELDEVVGQRPDACGALTVAWISPRVAIHVFLKRKTRID